MTQLRDVSALVSGQHVLAQDVNREGRGVPYLTGPSDFVSDAPRASSWTTNGTAFAQAGDILITVKGSGCGAMVVADQRYAISRQLMAVHPTQCDGGFLWVALQQLVTRLNIQSAGTIPGLTREQILNLPLPQLSAGSQRLVSRLHEKCRHHLRKLGELAQRKREFKRELLRELLSGRKCYRSIGATQFRKVRIAEWGEVRGGRQRSPHASGRPRPYLRVANVFDARIDTHDILEMPFGDDEFERYAVLPGDILLNEGQSSELVGRCAMYEGLPGRYAYQNTLVRFRAGPECEPLFALELFRHLWQLGVFEQISKKTTSIAHLGVERFGTLQVQVPGLAVQQRIASLIRVLNDEENRLATLLTLYSTQQRALMQRLLSGDLPDLDPAA